MTTRVTTFTHDWRGRRIATEGEEDIYEEASYDNLDRVTQVRRRDTSSGGNLVAQSETKYDDRGRVYQALRYSVNPSTGSVGHALTDNSKRPSKAFLTAGLAWRGGFCFPHPWFWRLPADEPSN